MIISLKGQSSFWIFNRVEKKVKPGDIIIKFQKEYVLNILSLEFEEDLSDVWHCSRNRPP